MRKPFPKCLDCKKDLKDYRSVRCIHCANTGIQHPRWGKKATLETRLKMSLARKGDIRCAWRKGKHLSEKHRKAISLAQIKRVKEGKHNFWKGGIYPYNLSARVKFRQQVQKRVFERDNYTCQLCGIRGVNLQVDHIQSWAKYVELRFCIDNCRTLCMKCHYQITYNRPMPKNVKVWGQNFKHLERGAKL